MVSLEDKLIDEMILCVVPVMIGKGTPLFKEGRAVDLTLTEARPLQTGGVVVRYAVNA